jgi:hypothetical protein
VTLLVTYQFACDAGGCNRATEEIFARGPVSAWRVAQGDGWTGQRRHYCPGHAEIDTAQSQEGGSDNGSRHSRAGTSWDVLG